MKNIKLIVLLLLIEVVLHFQMKAQGNIDLTKLQPPSSPAFTILGVTPTDISTPKTLDALETNLFSSFSKNNNFIIPNNYALEFSPYWLVNHPYLTFKDYYNNINSSWSENALQNLAFSVATTNVKSTVDTSSSFQRMGVGFRVLLFDGKVTDNTKQLEALMAVQLSTTIMIDAINRIDTNIKISNFITVIDNEIDNHKELSDSEKKAVKNYCNSVYTANETSKTFSALKSGCINYITKDSTLKNASKNLQASNSIKSGFMLELASAMVLDFPTSDIGYSRVNKWGIWISPSYRIPYAKDQNYIQFLGVLRYMKNELADSNYADNFDYGLKVAWGLKNFSISFEVIGRIQSEVLSAQTMGNVTVTTTKSVQDTKYDFTLNYKISNTVMFSYSFGRNFTYNTEYIGNLISTVSINFGFGGSKVNTTN